MGDSKKEKHHVHFNVESDLLKKDNDIKIETKGDDYLVHLGFLKLNHKYSINFLIPKHLCSIAKDSQVLPTLPVLENPNLKVIKGANSQDGVSFHIELLAYKEGLMVEEFSFRQSGSENIFKVALNAKVLGKGKGTPLLKKEIHVIHTPEGEDSDASSEMEPSRSEMDSASKSFKMGEGDWFCLDPQCGNINFARRTKCNRCNKERAEVAAANKKKLGTAIGKAAAEKSKGLFSADDWSCNKCGNVNWARRQQCNMCNAPKWGEVEERTGYGGGYNDRGVVEYKERQDSDDDYDEFGRRKKKKSKTDEDSNHEDRDKDVEEEEEEEEEEDDGDLSKYDLSDWGDATEEKDQKDKDREGRFKNHSEREERSRSRSPTRR